MKPIEPKQLAKIGALLRQGQFKDVHLLLVEARNTSEEQFKYLQREIEKTHGEIFRPYWGIGWVKAAWTNWEKAPAKKPRATTGSKPEEKQLAEANKS